mmetsp:Transcript_53190/g.121556  ORF Transcript_53190/g.121556 Transcript_53190/m.121556 type:complete len:201 (+) Transcript_53190:2492-3094(+)
MAAQTKNAAAVGAREFLELQKQRLGRSDDVGPYATGAVTTQLQRKYNDARTGPAPTWHEIKMHKTTRGATHTRSRYRSAHLPGSLQMPLHPPQQKACWLAATDFRSVLIDVRLCESVAPMLEQLTNHRADGKILSCGLALDYHIGESESPPACRSHALQTAVNLSCIVRRSPSLVKSAIPLKPSVGIQLTDPTTRLPHVQ